MPQASEQLRDVMKEKFGADWIEEGPLKFLKDAGYTLNADWTWSKSGVNSLEDMTLDEFFCMLFLIEEQDYGALRPTAESKS